MKNKRIYYDETFEEKCMLDPNDFNTLYSYGVFKCQQAISFKTSPNAFMLARLKTFNIFTSDWFPIKASIELNANNKFKMELK